MSTTLSPQEFVHKWRQVNLNERSASQSHFNDLCRLVGDTPPTDADPQGTWYTFEAGATKTGGGEGFADVWKRGYFAWEYKGPHANLEKAYEQLLKYREALENPPLLVVSDMQQIVVHTNFTNTVKQEIRFSFDDLLDPHKLAQLRNVFRNPQAFYIARTPTEVTTEAAKKFAQLAALLREETHDSQRVAHFLIRLLFCLFAEDIGLLPEGLFSRLIRQTRSYPGAFVGQLRQLFAVMSGGGWFGADQIPHFDGGLFDDDLALALDARGLDILSTVAELDWASIEPSILGILFERSLDPDKRAQLGAHYTGRDDILLIVEPVLMAPLRQRWEKIKEEANELAIKRDTAPTPQGRTRWHNALRQLLESFARELGSIQILDPACGSGNFLYVSLRQLLDLWKEVSVFGTQLGLTAMTPMEGQSPHPSQLHGIEINPYAHELAQATIWIGYLQWLRENGYGFPSEPILKPLHNILRMDAIMVYDAEGRPIEPEWPKAAVIIGNPPFLGDKRMRGELGDKYVDDLRALYDRRVPGGADLVTFWFEKARAMIESDNAERAGLLATNSIRQQGNRPVLERIKQSGGIFMAWDDRPWVLDGAAVRVSMIGFDDGAEKLRTLNGEAVVQINADLTSHVDVTKALPLIENAGICFLGMMKAGPFDIEAATAIQMLAAPLNPNGRPNSDVVRPRLNGQDITGRPRDIWVIDFVDMAENEAALYEMPFEYVRQHVKPIRDTNRRERTRRRWWIFGESRPGLRRALRGLPRCIVTPEVAKYRLFVWMDTKIVPDHRLHVIARDDDYCLGILQSRVHEVWSLAQCAWMGVGNDPSYSSSRTFEMFPFPWPPGKEPQGDPRVEAIAEAARELVATRDAWLNPPGASETDLKRRTLTNLYNQRPAWLDLAHKKLDRAVFDAYGWPHNLTDENLLALLLALNLERAKVHEPTDNREG